MDDLDVQVAMDESRPAITVRHRDAFWAGVTAVSAGVVLHRPMYVSARDMGYHMAGMPMDAPMKVGMAAVLGAVPICFAVLAVARYGVEAQRRRLEDITAT